MACWRQSSCRQQEFGNLIISVDVRCEATVPSTEQISAGDCCVRIVLRAEFGERANYLQPSCRGYRRGHGGLPLRPLDDELQGQWSFVTGIVREARECQQS